MARPRDKVWLWLILFAIACAIAVFLAQHPAQAAPRSQQHWGGSDFEFSCDTVRKARRAINSMSAERRAALAKEFNITRKQRRQAYACLRGK